MEIITRNKRSLSPTIDLTPMVDLGFLLITFFMLATAFTKPKVMEVLQPDATGSFEYPESKTSTILLGPGDIAYCYSLPESLTSLSDLVVDSVSYHAQGLRKYIMKRQAEVAARWGDSDPLFLIIKPLDNAPYARLVDILDEVLITGVGHYAIVDLKTQVDSMIMRRIANTQ